MNDVIQKLKEMTITKKLIWKRVETYDMVGYECDTTNVYTEGNITSVSSVKLQIKLHSDVNSEELVIDDITLKLDTDELAILIDKVYEQVERVETHKQREITDMILRW